MSKKKIKDRNDIKLLNYGTSSICVSSGKNEYLFEGSKDGEPVAYFFDWNEVDGINTRTNVLKTGAIAFDVDDRYEGYPALKLHDWETTILFDEVIDEIIDNPTKSNMDRILNIRDVHTIERFRGKVLSRVNTGRGVDVRFLDVVNSRFKEINDGIIQSKLLVRTDVNYGVSVSDVAELKEKNAAMEQELVEMKNQMAELLKRQKKEDKKDDKKDSED